jgi:hypothetical protein
MVVIKRKELSARIHKWEDLEARRRAIEIRCPENQWPSCPSEQAGPCWDGSDRSVDCSCAQFVSPDCPATPCAGDKPRDMYDCSCPPLITAPDAPVDVSITNDCGNLHIKWQVGANDGGSPVLGSQTMIQTSSGEWVVAPCEESADLQFANGECSFSR